MNATMSGAQVAKGLLSFEPLQFDKYSTKIEPQAGKLEIIERGHNIGAASHSNLGEPNRADHSCHHHP